MEENELLINEGGIRYKWFTKIRINPDDTVTILKYYRKHISEEFTKEELSAINHPEYYHQDIWKVDDTKLREIALEYNVPELGWKKIENPKYIFDYNDYREEEISKKEAKKIIKEIAEAKKSAIDIYSITEESADEKFKELNPECYSVKEEITEEDLFKKLKVKIEEKKKFTNYPNARTEDERKIHRNIDILESALYDTYQVPLFKFGLAENLAEGFEWLVDDILLTYARFDKNHNDGEKATKELFPGEKAYEYSEDAKKFIDFIKCKKEDYKVFAIEFIKNMCGK